MEKPGEWNTKINKTKFRGGYKSRTNIVALPFCELDKIIDELLGKNYVSNPVTLGERLKIPLLDFNRFWANVLSG
jgi:hypothetical protein